MDSLLRANTLRLQEHADIVRQERRSARLLVEQLRLARRNALPEDAWRYDQLIGKADSLERYFDRMSGQVEYMSDELVQLSVKLGMILDEAGGRLKRLEK